MDSLDGVSQQWVETLAPRGYEHHCNSLGEAQRLTRWSRAWQRILGLIDVPDGGRFFEVGVGGGKHAVQLALNGYTVYGIDVSPEVIERCTHFVAEVSRFVPIEDRVAVEVQDLFQLKPSRTFDVSYHFGVVEHFLDDALRHSFWQKMLDSTRPGGWIVSVVPNGAHFERQHIRRDKLCGYDIPEIDYSVERHTEEFRQAGLVDIRVVPHSFLGFYNVLPAYNNLKLLYKGLYIGADVLLPLLPLSARLSQKIAYSLIAVGRVI